MAAARCRDPGTHGGLVLDVVHDQEPTLLTVEGVERLLCHVALVHTYRRATFGKQKIVDAGESLLIALPSIHPKNLRVAAPELLCVLPYERGLADTAHGDNRSHVAATEGCDRFNVESLVYLREGSFAYRARWLAKAMPVRTRFGKKTSRDVL